MIKKLLEIKDLRVIFQIGKETITAVDSVDLSVNDNETLVLAGESGSGKTITSLAITKVLPERAKIISGSIRYKDTDLLRLDETSLTKIRGKDIAYIFQEPVAYLNPVFTIGNQITETIMLHQQRQRREAEKEAIRLLSLVKLKDPERVFHSYSFQLSGGMNQRAFIAMSLACNPRLLIADEPTTSLDVTIEKEILNLLIELKQEFGFSLLFITHNLSIAHKIADRVVVMYQGKIVEDASVQQIFAHPTHAHTKELIAAYQEIGKL